ncbi:MAG TPA: nucleotidyltransferase family protein [Ferruginibacter sp.]|nr:nucleotidyltransferase family protein [Ferruginibacter sp.]
MSTPQDSELQSSPFRFPDKGKNEVRGGQAIILAGGLGTRLRSVVPYMPKCMAPVAGKPFLYFVIEHLKNQGVDKFIFSLGYKHEMIEEWLHEQYPDLQVQTSVEDEPLGTGGAIKLGCTLATEKNVLILNGDTLFKINTAKLLDFHEKSGADCTLSLKPMHNFDRYGVVEISKDHSIASFKEKQQYEKGLINGGVYVLKKNYFLKEQLPRKFSFENDYLEKYFEKRRMYAVVQDEYFIDIGIPEDYERAQQELKIEN